MPPFGPIKRNDLIFFLRRAGFAGPERGGKHQYMTKGQITIPLPNPHRGDIGKGLLARILQAAGISRAGWQRL